MTVKRFLACFLGALLILTTPFLVNKPVSAKTYADSGGKMAEAEYAPVTAAAATGNSLTKYVYIYDENDNPLFYHRQTKAVFNQKGEVVYDNTSAPITYDEETRAFSNGQNDLRLASRPASVGSGQYLQNGSYKVRSTSIDDTLWELPKKTGGYEYVSVIKVSAPWYEWIIGVYAHLEYYDMFGKKLDTNTFAVNVTTLLSAKIPTEYLAYKTLNKYPKATLGEWLDLLSVAVLDNSAPSSTTLNIYDDTNHPIKIIDGQACDYAGFPLIGKDSKPILYGSDTFWNYGGTACTLRPHPAIAGATVLYDGDTVAHSVIDELRNNDLLYFIYLSDGALCPVYGIPEKDKAGHATGKVKFYYLNGDAVDGADMVEPEISEEDIYIRDPELQDTRTWLDKLLGNLGGIFGNLLSGMGDTLLIFIIIVAVILLIPLLPYIVQGLMWLIKAVIFLVKQTVKGIVALFKKIFKKENMN